MKIEWNGFLKKAVEDYPNEACAFLFSEKLYSTKEKWHVFPVKNISEDPIHSWIPDKREMLKIKNKAIKMGLVKIGNIHTHPYPEEKFKEEVLQEILKPSDKDLKFARKFNDVIRGIIVCNNKAIYDIYFHDKFGNKIDIIVDGLWRLKNETIKINEANH